LPSNLQRSLEKTSRGVVITLFPLGDCQRGERKSHRPVIVPELLFEYFERTLEVWPTRLVLAETPVGQSDRVQDPSDVAVIGPQCLLPDLEGPFQVFS
jgi:hypothetical protein